MQTVNATQVKNRFGEVVEQARKNPVLVKSHGRSTVVILDHEEYERLLQMENAYWIQKADEAAKSGYLNPKETMGALNSRLDLAEE